MSPLDGIYHGMALAVHQCVRQSILCVQSNSKNTFQNLFIFGHKVYWDVSVDTVET